jgi:glutamine cyclotransferase
MRKIAKHFIGLLCLSLAASVTQAIAGETKQLGYQIIAERSHKPQLFTQGLLVKDNYFYESSGLYGKSQLVVYPVGEPEGTWAKMTAPFTHKQHLGERYFAEGLTLLDNKLYLLTWQEQTLFVYDAKSFAPITRLNYTGEGG